MQLDQVKKYPKARGRNELIAHLEGARNSFKKAILAKCYDCTGGYIDGKDDCQLKACPLHPFMPFRDTSNDLPRINSTAKSAAKSHRFQTPLPQTA